jgi:hypothetical protein
VISGRIDDLSKCEGTNASFTVTASGDNLKYQWTAGGKNISGATTSALTLTNLKPSDGNLYSCTVSNGCGSNMLPEFLLYVALKPTLNIIPITQIKDIGDSVAYYLSPGGTPPFTYQWMKNNSNIPGATLNSYKIKPITAEDAGIYSCRVSNDCGTTSVNISTLVVNTGAGYTVSGYIKYNNKSQSPMYNTTVYLLDTEGDTLSMAYTDAYGAYSFVNAANGEYKLRCSTTIKWGGGTPIDALYINRYYIGLYTIGDNLKKKAADVSGDGKINPADALAVNRRFTGLISYFSAGDWIFETPAIIVNGGDVTQDIKAICTGDVDGSYNP